MEPAALEDAAIRSNLIHQIVVIGQVSVVRKESVLVSWFAYIR